MYIYMHIHTCILWHLFLIYACIYIVIICYIIKCHVFQNLQCGLYFRKNVSFLYFQGPHAFNFLCWIIYMFFLVVQHIHFIYYSINKRNHFQSNSPMWKHDRGWVCSYNKGHKRVDIGKLQVKRKNKWMLTRQSRENSWMN